MVYLLQLNMGKIYDFLVIIYLITTVFAFSNCRNQDCPECFNSVEPFKIALINAQSENLLNPSNPDKLIINKIQLSSGEDLTFIIKDYIDISFHTGFYFLESIDSKYSSCSIDKDCQIHISYINSSEIDTINIYNERVTETNDEGCICTGHIRKYIKHNGNNIAEFDLEPNNTGAAIVRK